MLKRLTLILFLFLLLICNKVSAQDTVVVSDVSKMQSIEGQIAILTDAESSRHLLEVINDSSFVVSKQTVPNLGISNNSFWVRMRIKNQTELPTLLLRLEYPIIDELNFYTLHESKLVDSLITGESQGYNARQFKNQNFIYTLNIPSGESRELYIRIKTGEQLQLPFSVGSSTALFEELVVKDLVFGLYIGIILVMAIYNLFVFFTVRDRSYIYYVSYIVFVGATQAVLQGYGFKYLWPNSVWMVTQSTFLIPVLNGWTAILFVKHFLNTKQNYPLGNRILDVTFFFYFVCFLLSLFNQFYFAQNLVQLTALVGSLLTIHIAYKIGKQGFRPANYFLVAWTIFLLSVVVFVLRNFNILPYNNFTYYSLQVGSALEVTLLSFALADKINIYRKEKEQSQERALFVSQENERIIREQNVVLEIKVEERTKALHQSNLDLSFALDDLKNAQTKLVDAEKMASLGQLTAGIAHEINNPINFVSSNIRPLRRDIDDIMALLERYELIVNQNDLGKYFDDALKLKKEIDYDYLIHEIDVLLKGMADGAGRTVEIVKGLKSFSRLDESDLKFANINEGIESTLIILNSTFKGRVAVVKELDPIPEVECYAGKLNQVFMNIINNAAQAVMAAHPNDDQGQVVIQTKRQENGISIHIRDNGTGMNEETRSKIFEPFFTTKKAGEGTGLGLSIVYSIIELHKGSIVVESTLGEGTEFIITLPFHQ